VSKQPTPMPSDNKELCQRCGNVTEIVKKHLVCTICGEIQTTPIIVDTNTSIEELENHILALQKMAKPYLKNGDDQDWDEFVNETVSLYKTAQALLTERERLSRIDEVKTLEDAMDADDFKYSWSTDDGWHYDVNTYVKDRIAHLSNPERGEKKKINKNEEN